MPYDLYDYFLKRRNNPIFTETTTYDFDVLLQRLKELAFLNSGIVITFRDERLARLIVHLHQLLLVQDTPDASSWQVIHLEILSPSLSKFDVRYS